MARKPKPPVPSVKVKWGPDDTGIFREREIVDAEPEFFDMWYAYAASPEQQIAEMETRFNAVIDDSKSPPNLVESARKGLAGVAAARKMLARLKGDPKGLQSAREFLLVGLEIGHYFGRLPACRVEPIVKHEKKRQAGKAISISKQKQESLAMRETVLRYRDGLPARKRSNTETATLIIMKMQNAKEPTIPAPGTVRNILGKEKSARG